jgi:hypothetical protein
MDQKERLVKARTFLNEYRVATGITGENKLLEEMIPDLGMPTVRMTAQQVKRFRNDYWLLVSFAALVCDCTVEELTPFHLMAPFLKAAMEANRDDEV